MYDIVVASNSEQVLQSNLLSSPNLKEHAILHVMRGFKSASAAYNAGIDQCSGSIAIFVHQDVYLPEGWFATLSHKLALLESRDPQWAVVGTFGVSTDFRRVGHVYTNGLGATLGGPFSEAIEVQSLDELLIIVNLKSGLRFDEKLKGFHLYGTDICQAAIDVQLKAYVLDLFCIHNSNSVRYLNSDFWRCCAYVRNKWKKRLPIQTPCTPLKKSHIYTLIWIAHRVLRIAKKKIHRTSAKDPSLLPASANAQHGHTKPMATREDSNSSNDVN